MTYDIMERYKNIIDGWPDFKQECKTQAKKTIRKNSIKAGTDFEKNLKEDFPDAEQSDWNPNIFRLNTDKSPGKSMLHWHGDYYVQEESASFPAQVLNPKPGDDILDMCGAPGGKTTQIASKISNKGMIISNDKNSKRLQSLHANIYRTGSTSVRVTNYDGRRIPKEKKFDKILVDVPCSGEGNRARRSFQPASRQNIRDLAKLQEKLLLNAGKLLKKGGTLIYSTCTFSPQENEAVIESVVDQTKLKLTEMDIDAPHQRGIREFNDQSFRPEMRKTVRIYPHHLQSGGIYIARLKK